MTSKAIRESTAFMNSFFKINDVFLIKKIPNCVKYFIY